MNRNLHFAETTSTPAWVKGKETQKYFENEWGRVPLTQEALLEHLTLFVFQTGLTWETVLKYREGIKDLFFSYDLAKIVEADDQYFLDALESDAAIIRNLKKIEVCRENIRCIKEYELDLAGFLIEEYPEPLLIPGSYADLPHVTDRTRALAANLKEIGCTYIGPTAIGSLLQATGLIALAHP